MHCLGDRELVDRHSVLCVRLLDYLLDSSFLDLHVYFVLLLLMIGHYSSDLARLLVNHLLHVYAISYCNCCFVYVSFRKVFDVQTRQDEVFGVVAQPVIDKLASILFCCIC